MDNEKNSTRSSAATDSEAPPESASSSEDTASDNRVAPSVEAAASQPETLAQENAQLEQEIAKCRDLLARAHAAAANARKRAEREICSARVYALESFAGNFLEVKDNLERSLLSCDAAAASLQDLYEGVGLTLKQMTKAFVSCGIKEVNPIGEAFDPALHQAMNLQESSECPPNSVIEVMQKGYLLHDRLLRPALVTVSKPVSGNAAAADTES